LGPLHFHLIPYKGIIVIFLNKKKLIDIFLILFM